MAGQDEADRWLLGHGVNAYGGKNRISGIYLGKLLFVYDKLGIMVYSVAVNGVVINFFNE